MNKTAANTRKIPRQFALIPVLLIMMASMGLLLRGETSAIAAPRSTAASGPANAPKTAPQACGNPSFAPPVTYPAGNRGAAKLADFNHDGYLDYVSGSSTDHTVSILFGNASDGFNAPVTVATGLSPYAITVGDLNLDGFSDIVMTDFYGNSITVLLNNGDATFRVLPSVTVGNLPDSLLVADLNHDNFPDVAVSNDGSASISVLLGNGRGGFTSAFPFATGAGPQQVLVGDFNKDGNPDLTIANYQGGTVSVLINNGFGAFTTTNYPAGPGPASSVVGDFNSDGYLDTVVGNFSTRQVGVLLNDTNGHLYPPTFFPGGSQAGVMTSDDFNLDGIPDVVTANSSDGSLSVFLGNGAGGLSAATNYPVSFGGIGVFTGDMNKDGRPDLITGNSDNSVSVLLNTCGPPPGSFSDVPANSPFYPYITCLVNRTIISGYPDGTFRPGNNVSRGQLSKIVANSMGAQEDPGSQVFTDVPPSSPFYNYINRLTNRGVISGYKDPAQCLGTGAPCFKPDAEASRGQISKIVSNAASIQDDPGAQIFADVPSGSPFYDYINRLTNRGVMSGYNDPAQCPGTGAPCFKPANNATRGQTSKIVANTFFPNCPTQSVKP